MCEPVASARGINRAKIKYTAGALADLLADVRQLNPDNLIVSESFLKQKQHSASADLLVDTEPLNPVN